MANCIVTLHSSVAAVSGAVVYEPFPNQVVGGVAIDVTPIAATAASSDYTATLVQKAKYRLVAPRFPFDNMTFVCPAAASADLDDLLDGTFRAG